jgi:hypothetical protein
VDNIKPGASTLLHYLAKSIHSKDPNLLKFLEEVPHLEAAARISVPTLMNSCNSLVAGMNLIKEEIRVLKRIRISPPNDHFIDVMEVILHVPSAAAAVFFWTRCRVDVCKLTSDFFFLSSPPLFFSFFFFANRNSRR